MRRLAAILFFILSTFVVAGSFQMRIYTESGPGAGLFPMISGVMLGLLSAIWFFQEQRLVTTSMGGLSIARGALIRVGLQLLALSAFATLLEPVGYLASAAVLAVMTALIAGERNWIAIAVLAAAASFGVSYLFSSLGTTI